MENSDQVSGQYFNQKKNQVGSVSEWLRLYRKLSGTSGRWVKRLIDILISSAGIICLFPLFTYIYYRIRRDSPGPALFRGSRLGLEGQTFQILKFRTMYECPESYQGSCVTARDDPRVTPFGRWLRVTKLNELPQLWNVLKGEMSLVGPRPEDPVIGAIWPGEARAEILSIRPGITSPASLHYRDEEGLLANGSAMDSYLESIMLNKLRLDQLYVCNRTFWLDVKVLFSTMLLVLTVLRDHHQLKLGQEDQQK